MCMCMCFNCNDYCISFCKWENFSYKIKKMFTAWVSLSHTLTHLSAHKINWKITLLHIIRGRKRRIMWMLLFLPGFRFGCTHNHLTILCFMSHFNGQCVQCSVFHFNCNYNCGQFFFLQIFEERQNWPATVIFVHEQMSIITIKKVFPSWISFLFFSIISSLFCRYVYTRKRRQHQIQLYKSYYYCYTLCKMYTAHKTTNMVVFIFL